MSAIALYARETPTYAARVEQATAVLRDAVARFGDQLVFTTSLGVEDMVITDLLHRAGLKVAHATLDTGRLHAETLALIPRLEAHYGLVVERWQPPQESVVRFVRDHGELAMRESVELRKACCALRKLEPLGRAMAGRQAWIAGLRREQSDARAEVALESPDGNGRTKFSPLADWTLAEVWHHVRLHGVPTNPLHDQFMPSIGCEPCTRAIAPGEDFRAGRWWWEQASAKECGLHASRIGA